MISNEVISKISAFIKNKNLCEDPDILSKFLVFKVCNNKYELFRNVGEGTWLDPDVYYIHTYKDTIKIYDICKEEIRILRDIDIEDIKKELDKRVEETERKIFHEIKDFVESSTNLHIKFISYKHEIIIFCYDSYMKYIINTKEKTVNDFKISENTINKIVNYIKSLIP